MAAPFVSIIMAGGSGKRFWPLSRQARAKQSLKLFSDRSLLRETIDRVLPASREVLIISSEQQRVPISEDIDTVNDRRVSALFEPAGRNTAPCVALATHHTARQFGGDTTVVILPADHYIADTDTFRKDLDTAVEHIARNPDHIGTIGITPHRPETGYGYIRKGPAIDNDIVSVESFTEKPDRKKAHRFFTSGDYLWNGGIFIFRADTMIEEFRQHAPDILTAVSAIDDPTDIDADIYRSIRSISVDYAIMEPTKRTIFSVPGDFGWNDIGSWRSYYELMKKDENGNAAVGPVHFFNSNGNLVVNQTDHTAFVMSKKNQLLVIAEDCSLSAALDDHQAVKKLVATLEESGMQEFL